MSSPFRPQRTTIHPITAAFTLALPIVLVSPCFAEPDEPAVGAARGKIVEVQKNYGKVTLADTSQITAEQAGLLLRGGEIIDTVVVSAVKADYFVCKSKSVAPMVGDEIAFSTEPSTDSPDAAGPPAEEVSAAIDALEGKQVDLKLATGATLRDAKLLRIVRDRESGEIKSLRVRAAGKSENESLLMTQVREIHADGKRLADDTTLRKLAGLEGVPATRQEKEKMAKAQRTAKEEEERARWLARLEVRGVEPWPELTDEEHDDAVAKHKEFLEKVGGFFPGMALHETKNFLFYTNIPPQQVGPYAVSLDTMHDMMCKMYNVAPGTRVWRGKALVVAFLNQVEFARFEAQFMQTPISPGIYGLCHQKSDGEVVIACYRGDRAEEFAQMLVHETSHGFIHRYKTPVHFPNWVNEGMADWVGLALVPNCKSVKAGERRAIDMMKQTRSMGGDFFTRSHIDAWQYGLSSNLAEFMIRTNQKAYIQFIEGMKEGMTWQESMKEAYGSTPEQFVAAYGQAIGVPDLRP